MRLTEPILSRPDLEYQCLAFDSHGVKGACVRVSTPDLTLVVDPGASLEGAGFPLPAAEQERLLEERLTACRRAAQDAQALVISHYHLDHFIEHRDPDLYRGKLLFVKDYENLPPKQADRADRFLRTIDGLAEEIIPCDRRAFRFGRTRVEFSEPVPHGARDAEPGAVIMTTIRRGRQALLITSDVCGPVEENTAELIIASKARTVILDGYPTHALRPDPDSGTPDPAALDLLRSIINACRILHARPLKTLILDHHSCRDYRYPAFLRLVYARAERLKKKFGTVAELAGGRSAVLRGLSDYGPTRWKKWRPFDLDQARLLLERAIAARLLPETTRAEFDRWVG